MHRITPEFIIENYHAGRHQGSLPAASMFLDISGFSALTDTLMGQGRLGAEVLAVMMGAVFDPLVEAIFGQGGTIVGYAGDSISALFPVDADEGSAARRALAAAQTIQEARAATPLLETPYGKFRVSAKIGLAIGSVSWGILRSRAGDRAVYFFRGDAVQGAALAEQQARGGDTILTDAMRRLMGSDVETEALGDLHALLRVSGDLPSARPFALPAIDPAVATVFAPAEVVTQDLQGEFRQTVHAFLRIPDLADDRLRQFIQIVFDLQARYGGLIDRIDFGDKGCTMSVLWGAPVAHENDIDRALNFMLALRTYVDFPVTAGATYYISHAGYVGSRLYETYTCYGWGLNLAARFAMSATENDIWVDERISQRVKERFHLEFVGEQSFKGFAQKQKVYVLHGRKSGAEPFFRGKMAGRQSELQRLAGFVAPLWAGQYPGVLGIWGEAGMGKSRLVYEFRHSAIFEQHACLWALCQCDEVLRHPFNPFRDWLLRYFEIASEQDHAARMQKFSAKVEELIAAVANSSLAGDLKRTRQFLATLLELEGLDSRHEKLDAQGRYDNTIIALISLLKAESLRQPVVLCIEDSQYLDEDSRAFVPRLKRALAADPISHPIAVLMTARWQGTNVLLEDNLIDQDLDLAGLPDDAISAMCRDFLGRPAAAPLIELVNERAEGNPFFAEQILHYLQEQELLELGPSAEWIMKPAGKSSALPADISAMLVARLDRLARRVREVIQAASVLGRVFDVPVLRRMLADQDSLQNDIAAAEQAAVWSALSEIRYIFSHSLLRDVAYNMQLQSRRRELHALACDALKKLFGGQIHRHYGELAYHSEQAALSAEACRYLSLAGDASRDQYQNGQALDFYRRALALVPATNRGEHYRLHRECEKLLAEQGQLDERSREIQTLQTLADAMGDRGKLAEVTLLRSRLLNSKGEYEAAASAADEAKQLAVEAARFDIATGAYLSLLEAFYGRGLYKQALDLAEAGIALAREHHAAIDQAYLLNILGLASLEMKNPSSASAYFEQSLSIFRAESNLRGVIRGLTNSGLVAGYQGNYSAALDYSEESLRLAREIGDRKAECLLLGNIGWISGLLGDYGKARAYAERSVQIAREIGDRYAETFSLINLSSHFGANGEFSSAIEYAERGRSLARRSNDRNMEAWGLTYLGHALLDSGLREPALAAYQEALTIRHELDQPALATEPAAGLARIALLQGDSAAARIHVNAILAQLEEDGTLEGTDQPLRVYLNCYRVLRELDDPRARGLLSTAHVMLKTRANSISDPSARQTFLENIPHNREIMSLWAKRP